jgi:hypothetical protein
MSVSIPVSIGELWDKYSILEIKQEKIKDLDKLKYIKNELDYLDPFIKDNKFDELFNKLKQVNLKLWTIEDDIREKELKKQFDDKFIDLARMVYKTNDMRAAIKKEIKNKFNSMIHEVKSYKKYC